jgi:hypothetical protein
MKRLIKRNYKLQPFDLQIGDNVKWKRHPYDQSVYSVKEVLPNGSVFIDNGINAYTNIKPSSLELISK